MNHTITNCQHISKHCLVCGTENQFGLKSRFFETTDKEVIGLFTPCEEHQSYPGIVHGGVSATILDETIGRAIMAHYDQNTFGVTIELQVKYKKPVPLGVELKVVGRLTSDRGRIFSGTGELYLPDGSAAVSAQGKYMKRTLDQISDTDFATEEWFSPEETPPKEISV